MKNNQINKLEHNAMFARKSWGRNGRKHYSKIVAVRAARRAGKAVCKETA